MTLIVEKDGTKYDISRTGKKTKIEPMNVWASAPEKDWEYVELPEADMYGYPYPKIIINDDEFERGKRYLVPPILAAEVERVKKAFEFECLALQHPKIRRDPKKVLAAAPGAVKLPSQLSAASD